MHDPKECARCGRGYHVKMRETLTPSGVLLIWVCCKDPQAQSAARADPRQKELPL